MISLRGCSTPPRRSPSRCSACSTTCCDPIPTSRSPTRRIAILVEKVTYRAWIADAIEERLYTPVIRAVAAAAGLVRRAHTGSVHLYLAYGALGVLIVLVVAR